jgi:ATP-dependent Clp protease adapter protein ClpS
MIEGSHTALERGPAQRLPQPDHPGGVAAVEETIPGMTMKRATRVTWEAHTKGRAVAKTCHKELAELYEERLRQTGLTVSIEPAS